MEERFRGAWDGVAQGGPFPLVNQCHHCFRQLIVRFERLRCLFRRMKRLLGVVQWLLIAFGLGVVALFAAHLALRPNPKLAASEQYHVLSAYIEPNLTGESHDLGSRNGLLVIDGRTTFSEPLVNSNEFKQYVSLVASTGSSQSEDSTVGPVPRV